MCEGPVRAHTPHTDKLTPAILADKESLVPRMPVQTCLCFPLPTCRLIRTNLDESDVDPFKEQLAQALFDYIPVGVGSQGADGVDACN